MLKKASVISGLTLIIALTAIFLPRAVPKNIDFKESINEVKPLLISDKIISDGALFSVSSIKNPLINSDNDLLIDIKNGVGPGDPVIVINRVDVNGITKWQGIYHIDEQSYSYLTVPFTPNEPGTYLIRLFYSIDGKDRSPLQFTINIEPVNESDSFETMIKINELLINDSVTLKANQDVNIELLINSNSYSFINVTRGVLVINIDGEHWIYETNINKAMPPLQTVSRKESLTIPPLADGVYKIKGYLYNNKNGLEEVTFKSFNLIINNSINELNNDNLTNETIS